MCKYDETKYLCGCVVTDLKSLCGYHQEDYSECMNWTEFKEKKEDAVCGRECCPLRMGKCTPAHAEELKERDRERTAMYVA